jgi:hypothetical protein
MSPTSLTTYRQKRPTGQWLWHTAEDQYFGLVDLEEPPQLSEWESVALARFAELERAAPNWDGYGALPASRIHADRAMRFLVEVMTDDAPMPDIVPLADGGIQLEWHGADVRVDFISDDEQPDPLLYVDQANDLKRYEGRDVVTQFRAVAGDL